MPEAVWTSEPLPWWRRDVGADWTRFRAYAAARPKRFLALAAAGYLLVALRTAWVTEDAYITFRTVDNFIHGFGLRWNVAERVQSYTHPLWMLVISAFYAVTREPYYTSLAVSLIFSLAAVGIVMFGLARSWGAALIAVAALAMSRAFVDYSTSGLENPLSHALLGGFLLILFRGRFKRGDLFLLSLTAWLTVLNRMDLGLMAMPGLGYGLWRGWRESPKDGPRLLAAVMAGATPFALWEAFSVIYYGFPFPNTAYAKLGTGIPAAALWRQGGFYFLNSLRTDPITLTAIAAGLLVGARGDGRGRAAAAGILLYLVYTAKVGGDFMSGRFFAAPVYAGAALIATARVRARPARALLAGVVLLGCFGRPVPTFLSGRIYWHPEFDAHGIADERGYYYGRVGLLRSRGRFLPPQHAWVEEGRRYRDRAEREGGLVQQLGNIGFVGYYAGPDVFLVDHYALSDPLLARLPAMDRSTDKWRIGHFSRSLPDGYLETVAAGENRIRDPDLAAFYDKLCVLTRGSIWRWERFVEIWKINTGAYDHLVRSYVDREQSG